MLGATPDCTQSLFLALCSMIKPVSAARKTKTLLCDRSQHKSVLSYFIEKYWHIIQISLGWRNTTEGRAVDLN